MKNLSHRAMFGMVSVRNLEVSRADRGMAEEMENSRGAEKGSVRAIQRLIPSVYLKEIDYVKQMGTKIHRELTIATDVRGRRILPTTLYEKHAESQNYWSAKHTMAFRVLEESWDNLVEKIAPKYIGRELHPGELPDAANLHRYFSYDVSYQPIPDNYNDWRLEGISPDEMKHLRAFSQNEDEYMWEQAAQQVYAGAHATISKFIDIVKNNEAKGLRGDATMENMREFAEVLKGMNIFDDPKLDQAYTELTNFIHLSAEEIRNNAQVREKVEKSSETIQELLAKYR